MTKMKLIDNRKDYLLCKEMVALATLVKKKLLITIGGTTVACKKPKNWIVDIIFDNIMYSSIKVVECEDKIKFYFD